MRTPHGAVQSRYPTGGRPTGHPRVVIVSESAVMRAGMVMLLRDQPLLLVDAIPDLEQLPSCAANRRAQVALVAPVGSLTAKLRSLLSHQPLGVHIVLLLPPAAVRIHSETLEVIGSIRCLSLEASRDAIVRALIRPATRLGGGLLTERVSRGPGGRLTPRQQQVLDCLACGLSNCEIAAQLAIREDTVKAHLGAIYRKLSVKSRAEAITAYLEIS
jgi:DNA-binding NarL/FixJ family response regulator